VTFTEPTAAHAAAVGDRTTGRAQAPARATTRLDGLDGIRGLAATFVVLHHCWLLAFASYPRITGPKILGFLIYGHFAVVVFIALSGFSLAVSPARHDWQLGSRARFAHRRAWRILPPYWAALAFSLLIAWFVVPQPNSPAPDAKSVGVYGLLLQDVFGATSPNGAFWSIAIEAQLYLVFPLLLLLVRRAHAMLMLGVVTAIVVAIAALHTRVSLVDMLTRFSPQMAVLFAGGLVAAGILRAGPRARALPWHWFAGAAFVPVIVLIVVQGSEWTVHNFIWVDMALAPGVCLLLAAVATHRPGPLLRLLDTRPVRALGSFSYSLYLVHAPIVTAVALKVVYPLVSAPLARLGLTLLIAVPLSIAFARGFASVFELPFTRHRTWPELRAAIVDQYTRLISRRRHSPAHAVANPTVTSHPRPATPSRGELAATETPLGDEA
jgi:peptidoglycan/LPS O-acetylase OafA/YrhL